ncbi:MAG: DUF1835 domain-containing protein [Gemmatimonadetes bacterium]|nr:DUF1835 domain-containing protein [Gemmatimonadota bacterium]
MMLHVTNGDHAADQIRAAGVEGEILPWRDVLHEGPVPAGLPLRELSAVRAAFLVSQGVAPAEAAEEFAARDRALEQASGEIVLWFEHDLYDQLQLIQLLDWFAEHGQGVRLWLINPPEYLGTSAPERLAAWFAERQPVTPEQLALGRRAWAAFRAPDPTGVQRVMEGDTAALPFLAAALRRHLEQLPSVQDGLGRTERQLLEAVEGGAATIRDAFVEHNRREDPVWLGDLSFLGYVDALAAGPRPLLVHTPAARPMEGSLRLTPTGRDVLAAREDCVRANGIDRWYGGVHLRGHEARWRWDGGEVREG